MRVDRRTSCMGRTVHLGWAALCVAMLCGADWRQFRGTDNVPVAADVSVPLRWGPGENIAWRTELPGRTVSGPIVVGGRVIVTADSGNVSDRLHVVCFDAASGQKLWHRQFWATGRTVCHPTSAVSAPTPASDGQQVYAYFSSNDLICLDLDGNLKWMRGLTLEFPTAANDLGMSSSPLVVGRTVIVQSETKGHSFLAGINTEDGQTRWKLSRPAMWNWSSPTVLRGASPAKDLVVVQGPQKVEAIDPFTGQVVQSIDVACGNIPSIAVDAQRLFVPAENNLVAIQRQPSGWSVAWEDNRLLPSGPSPVAYDGKVYALKRTVLVCGDARTGELLWQLRLKGNRFWATPVIAGRYLYVIESEGLAQVVDIRSDPGKVVAENKLDDEVLGTPAVADGALYVRGRKYLWKIAESAGGQ